MTLKHSPTARRALRRTLLSSVIATALASASVQAAEPAMDAAGALRQNLAARFQQPAATSPALALRGLPRVGQTFDDECDPLDPDCEPPPPDPCDLNPGNPEFCPIIPIYDPNKNIITNSAYVEPSRPDKSYQFLEAGGTGYIWAKNDIHISLPGAQRNAVWARGADSTIRLAAGTTINLAGDMIGVMADAVRSDGGHIILDDAVINATNSHAASHPHTNDALRTTTADALIEGKVTVTSSGSNAASAHAGNMDFHDSSFSTTGEGVHTLYANGDSTDNTNTWIRGGGTIVVRDSTVHRGWGAGHAAYATGGRIELHDSSVDTITNNAHGLYATNGANGVAGTIVANNTDVKTTGTGAHAVFANGRGVIAINGGDIQTTGNTAFGLVADNGASIQALSLPGGNQGTSVSTTGANAHAIIARNASNIALNGGGSISAQGSNAHALYATGGSSIALLDAATDISAEGTGAYGVFAEGVSQIQIAGGSVSSKADDRHAVYATGGSTIAFTDNPTAISTEGARAHGAYVSGTDSLLVTQGGSVQTLGDQAHGLFADGAQLGSLGVTDISTQGGGSIGAWAHAGSTLVIGGGSITTAGDAAHGLLVDGGSHAIIDGAPIQIATTGETAYGIHLMEGSQLDAQDTGISTAGAQTHALFVQGSQAQLGQLDIATLGEQAIGAYATDTSTVVFKGGKLRTEGKAATALLADNDSLLGALGRTEVETLGEDAIAAHARNDSTLVMDGGGSISTAGDNAHALFAQDTSLIDARGGAFDITTGGAAAHGAYVVDQATLLTSGGSITTHGDGSHGLSADAGTLGAMGSTAISTSGEQAFGARATNAGTLLIGGGSVATAGDGAHALYADGSGTLLGSDAAINISTEGANAYGAYAIDQSQLLIQGGSVQTHGADAHGLYADNAELATGSALRISTAGDNAIGALASGNATLELHGAQINTVGQQAHGLLADGASITSSATVDIHSLGDDAIGAYARNGGILQLDGALINTAGARASGLQVDDATLLASAMDITTQGDLAHGIAVRGDATDATLSLLKVETRGAGAHALDISGAGSVLPISDSQFVSQQSSAVNLQGDRDLEIQHSLLQGGAGVLSSNGDTHLLLSQGSHGESLDPAASLIDNQGGSLVVDLSDSSLKGLIRTGELDLNLQAGGLWTMTDSSAFAGTLDNAGTLYSTQLGMDTRLNDDAGLYKTLQVSDYVSNGGRWHLNTYLGGDGAPTDLLVADTVLVGAGGPTLLNVDGTGGGAPTQGSGIEIVHVNGDSAASASDAFELESPVVGGAWNYALQQHGRDEDGNLIEDGNWYLRNEGWRPDLSAYLSLNSLVSQADRALLETMHERVGDKLNKIDDDARSWVRVFGRTGGSSVRSQALDEGQRNYDYSIEGMQVGLDPYYKEWGNGGQSHAGLRLGYLRAKSHAIQGNDDLPAGSSKLSAYSVGLQWSRFAPTGAYIDAVLLGTWYHDVEVDSPYVKRGSNLGTSGLGSLASIEVGKPWDLGRNWKIEPQAQVFHSHTALDKSRDYSAEVDYHSTDVTTARLGARLRKLYGTDGTHPGEAWMRLNAWHTFNTASLTTVAGPSGVAPENFRTDLGRRWGQAGLGMSTRMGKDATLFFSADYEFSLDGNREHSIDRKSVV